MEYIKGYLRKNLDKWLNKKWYHQRFDGSPYLMWMVSEGEIATHFDRKKGTEFTVHFVFFENDHVDWYISVDDNNKITKKMIELGRADPKISSVLLKLWKKDEALFFKKCLELDKIELGDLSDIDLIKLHDELRQVYTNRCSSSSTIDGFALGSDEVIAEKIKKVYDKKKSPLRFAEVFSILTAPLHLSFVNEADLSLLKVGTGKKSIEQHQKEYFWLNNNYVDRYVLDVAYFSKELERLKSMDIDLAHEIKRMEHFPSENKKRKGELVMELEPDDELKFLIKISEDFTHWQDERKRSTLWATHYFSLFLEEISKRVGISVHELKYMTPSEVGDIFKSKPDRKVLKERIKNSLYYMDKEGTEALTGKEVKEIRSSLLGKKSTDKADDFRGLTASLGKAIGKVRIVRSAKEIGKVEKGDILVAVMTRPDYVPAMKRAAAIVTDEGGVTCHAAIVSRELGVPCIIGTKIATKVLTDGQLVEVNANHGWVKIIKK